MLKDHVKGCCAHEVCKMIAGRVIGHLQTNTQDMQSADGTLTSLWDEMCVQVQGGSFFFWESYLDEARHHIREELAKCSEHETSSFWTLLREWMHSLGGSGVAPDEADAVDYILDHYLLVKAERWQTLG